MKPKMLTRSVENKVPGAQGRTKKEQNIWAVVDGRKVARITLPKKHSTDIAVGTLNSIRKQSTLSPEEFERFVDCELTLQEYTEILRRKMAAGEL